MPLIITQADGTTSNMNLGANRDGTRSLGIVVSPGGSPITSIRFRRGVISGSINNTLQGVDNIALFTSVPEPCASTILFALGTLIGIRRGRP